MQGRATLHYFSPSKRTCGRFRVVKLRLPLPVSTVGWERTSERRRGERERHRGGMRCGIQQNLTLVFSTEISSLCRVGGIPTLLRLLGSLHIARLCPLGAPQTVAKPLTGVHDGDGLLRDGGAGALDGLGAQVELVEHAGVQVVQGDGGLVGREGLGEQRAQNAGAVDWRGGEGWD